MTERGKGAPRKPSAALTAALAQIAALQLENLTIGDLKEKVAALEHDVERKWQPTELELRARIAELEPRLASAEAALAQWSKIIPCPGFFLIRPAPISRNIRRRRCEPKAHLLHLAASTLAMANV
jgi:hypothetical protein